MITPRENLLRIFRHQVPRWLPGGRREAPIAYEQLEAGGQEPDPPLLFRGKRENARMHLHTARTS